MTLHALMRLALALGACCGCRYQPTHSVPVASLPGTVKPQATPRSIVAREWLADIGGHAVYRMQDAVCYRCDLAIDADGAPRAYHPTDDTLALDFLANGYPWGIVIIDGTPVVQGPHDPAPGFYVSTTSLVDSTRPLRDPRRYVDSTQIPYVVVPKTLLGPDQIHLGDLAVVIDVVTSRQAYAIIADVGPADTIGEGSIALASSLGLRKSPKHGGAAADLVYVLLPGTGSGKPLSVAEINARAERAFTAWGGAQRTRVAMVVQ